MARRCAFTAVWMAVLLPANIVAAAQALSPVLLVLEKEDKSLAIIDPGNFKVVGRVDAGEDPHEVVASEDGKFAYISNYGAFSKPGNTLSVVDLIERKKLPAATLGLCALLTDSNSWTGRCISPLREAR